MFCKCIFSLGEKVEWCKIVWFVKLMDESKVCVLEEDDFWFVVEFVKIGKKLVLKWLVWLFGYLYLLYYYVLVLVDCSVEKCYRCGKLDLDVCIDLYGLIQDQVLLILIYFLCMVWYEGYCNVLVIMGKGLFQ